MIEVSSTTKCHSSCGTRSEWDKDDIDALGMMGVDLLALGMLSCLRRGFDLLRRHRGISLDLAAVPRDCRQTYAMLRRADSLGAWFETGSQAKLDWRCRGG
ncbi:hypothetical protein [Paracraurococcus lichenis]|uniref:DNA polymerase III alpha subunit finger domain-containing protein n=1 Tax=Paracraurococcus lichenis TaxID=3064888 RepID=A0ABT9EEA7_9PROT|nr:hypothetical protein [Paracraurococcus sp. LOR1-02]MDO9714431.1 hypothetical protein [Paracraurococcus sp. LOR1-02]